jgi:hypothetical protein
MDYRPTDLTGIRLWVAERMEISAALMTCAIEIDEAEEEWRTADEKLAQFLADNFDREGDMKKVDILAQLDTDSERLMNVQGPLTSVAGVNKYVATILATTGLDKAQEQNKTFYVVNEGVVAGPQTYATDVLDVDGVTVLHSAGDPVLDENGEQIVIAEEDAEKAFWQDSLTLPKTANARGMAYLAAKVLDGTIIGFTLKESRPDLGIFSYFTVEVMKNNGDMTVTPEMWRVQDGPDGQPFHVVIV